MPIYSYKCEPCDHVIDAYRSVACRAEAPGCDLCQGETVKIISSYRVHGDFEPYYDDNLETGIKSKKHRAQVMKEKGVYEKIGKGWSSW